MQLDQLPWPMQAALIIAVALLLHGAARLLWAVEEWLQRQKDAYGGNQRAAGPAPGSLAAGRARAEKEIRDAA